MPDTVESKDVNPTASSNTVLVSGFNLSSSQSEVKKKISKPPLGGGTAQPAHPCLPCSR